MERQERKGNNLSVSQELRDAAMVAKAWPYEEARKLLKRYPEGPGERGILFRRFRDWTGKYVMHCHNTVHEDHAMMIRFDIEG